MEEPILYLDDHRGQYIPQDFANETKHECVSGVSEEEWAVLARGPEHSLNAIDGGSPYYWDVWANVEANAKLTDPKTGVVYTLFQNGPLWLVPEGYENPDFFESV